MNDDSEKPKSPELSSLLNEISLVSGDDLSADKAILNQIITDSKAFVQVDSQLAQLITYIDLTTLSGDDTRSRIDDLVIRALFPIKTETNSSRKLNAIRCASICIYPARIKDAVKRMKQIRAKLPIASVAGGFPSGQYLFETRLLEVQRAIQHGAEEIDVVIDRSLALDGNWEQLYSEILQMKETCESGKAHLKVILSTGELRTESNIYAASMTAMVAGADFIKTSTGKEPVNATLETAFVMCKAIKRYYDLTGRRVGFKAAGGIKTADQAAQYLLLVRELLGSEWKSPALFRIGASSLLDDICSRLEAI